MRAALLFFACLTLSTLQGAWAAQCECLWQGAFSDVQADTDLVISATVAASKGNSIDLEPERILRGSQPPAPLRVWLKARDYCRPDASEFPVGSRWVFALHRISEVPADGFDPRTPNVSYGRRDDFSLSSCGGYWLRLNENTVIGNLVDAPRWVREPKMTPVLLDLVAGFVAGELPRERLLKASKEDPALRDLMLDTRSFLRNNQ